MTSNLEIYKHASFFKILLSDFSTNLRIPNEFVKKYGEILPEEVHLMISTDQSVQRTWNVKIKTGYHDRFCFENGWPVFVKDNQLAEMDFLVFKLIEKSTFQVAVYGKDGVLREPPPSSPCFKNSFKYCPQCEASHSKLDAEQINLSGNKSLTAVLKKYRKYLMVIPKAFAVETGIAKRSFINLQKEGECKKWRVKIRIADNNGSDKVLMTKGLHVFFEENKVAVGADLRFEFDATSGNLILKKETETAAKNVNNMIVPAKRGRGRPRKN